MNIRPFQETDDEYRAWIELSQVLDPAVYLTVDMLKGERGEYRAKNRLIHFVGELDGRMVASGMWWRSAGADEKPYQFSVTVHPDYQQVEVPRLMHDYVLEQLAQERPGTIASRVKEDQVYLTRLLDESGFEAIMRFPRSRLDVTQVDVAAYDELQTQLEREGIQFVTLSDVMRTDSEWQHNIWRMFTIIERDIPEPEPVQETSFEEYAEYYTDELFRPDSWAIVVDTALDGAAQYVGMCVVNLMPNRPDSLFAGITGVVPSHRRRKIATVLKAYSIRYGQGQGCRYILTDNEEHNPMYDLNRQLGFEPLPAWVYYRRDENQVT